MAFLVKPVILCGGSGTRLWPLSREDRPKQFIEFPLGHLHETSLFRLTLERIDAHKLQAQGDIRVLDPVIVAAREQQFTIAGQLKDLSVKAEVFLEPCARNTAAALTMAALWAEDEDPVLAVLPSDQMMDAAVFNQALTRALPACEEGKIVLLGVKPSYPETGYGYIRAENPTPFAPVPVASFVEKPNYEKALSYLADGNYLWNAGIFLLKASVWLRALRLCAPMIEQTCRAAFALRSSLRQGEITVPQSDYEAVPQDSIDYAVMEKCAQHHIPVEVLGFYALWTDLGSWKAVYDAVPHNAAGNFTLGKALAQDCENTLLISTGRLLVGNGLKNLAVLEMPDAVLATTLEGSQSIKKLVQELRERKLPEAVHHGKGYRPWGYYDALDEGPGFKVKRLVVYPGASLSLQRHQQRAEHWTVVTGKARVRVGEVEQKLSADESVYIPKGQIHRLSNDGKDNLIVIEVQCGGYLGEDDIERFDDVYGRQ